MSAALTASGDVPIRTVVALRSLRASRLPAASRRAIARHVTCAASRRAAWPLARSTRMALGAMLVSARVAMAEPSPAKVTGCEFDAAALERALAVEQQGRAPAPPITVSCDATTATVTLHHPDRAPTVRTVDLADVPPPLAPRVVALVAVAAAHEPADPRDARAPTDEPAGDGVSPRHGPRTGDADDAARRTAGDAPRTDAARRTADAATPADGARIEDSVSPGNTARVGDRPEGAVPSRPSLARDGLGPMRVTGVVGRGLVRVHDGETRLWGAGAAFSVGPASLGVTAAGTRVEHTLGTLTPWLAAADAGVTVACAGLACVGVRGEIGRIWVAGDANQPMMVTSETLSATYLHGAAEVSFDARLGGIDVAATAALGASRGVIARAGADAAAVLAGWTLTGAIEVRR